MDWFIEDKNDEDIDANLIENIDYTNVLIVDDEEDIHTVTKLAMKDFLFERKQMCFFSAYSASEAKDMLQGKHHFSLILLDVVMENDHAGLELAKYIRQELKNSYTRIILRTGQPGLAPEHSVIRDFDIDGYRNKTELSKEHLESTFYTSLRAYRDICQLQKHRKILEQVIDSIANVSSIGDLFDFAGAVLAQIGLVLNITTSKMLVESSEAFAISKMEDKLNMFSASASKVQILVHSELNDLPDYERDLFNHAMDVKGNFHKDLYYVYFHHSDRGYDTIFAFKSEDVLVTEEIALIDLFLRNVLLSYENLLLANAFQETQELAITLMGGTMESHSKETGAHVVRVGLYAKQLALLNGESNYFSEQIRLAAQLHDVGKVGIPDYILKKEDRLNPEEWELMKQHVIKGWEILNGIENSIIKMAAKLALDHHEKWDGSGYPNGKKQLEICLEGRITALADVFDALSSKRSYKEAWPLSEVKERIQLLSGSHLDPCLVKLFIENFDSFVKIKISYPDGRM
jgi:response regulator RpfG family c-di-GMP phosphodiesterase